MSLATLIGMMGGKSPVVYGPVPVISSPSISTTSTAVCNKGTILGTYSVKVAWSLTNSGSSGYVIKVVVSSGATFTISDSVTSFSFSPAKIQGTVTTYTVNLSVVRADGTVMQTIAAGTVGSGICT